LRYATMASVSAAFSDKSRRASAISRDRRARSSRGNSSNACPTRTCPSGTANECPATRVPSSGFAAWRPTLAGGEVGR
jgi:hypothetical protein